MKSLLLLFLIPSFSFADWQDDMDNQAAMYSFAMQAQDDTYNLQAYAQWIENVHSGVLIQDQNPYIFYMSNDTSFQNGSIYYFNYFLIENIDGSSAIYHNYVDCSNGMIEELGSNSYQNYGEYYTGYTSYSDPWAPASAYKNPQAMQEIVNMICNS